MTPTPAPRCVACTAPGVVPAPAPWWRCPRCGLLFADPLDAPGAVDYARAYARAYASGEGLRVERARARLFAQALATLAPFGSRRCLDVGCGMGVFVRFAAALGWTAIGVDHAIAPTDGPGFQLVEGRFPDRIPAEADGPFALVTFFNSLTYVDDPIAVLAAAHARLEPGGLVIIRVPNAAMHRRVARVAAALRGTRAGAWLAAATVRHPRSYTPRALREALTLAGFDDVRVVASPPVPGDPYGTGATALGLVKIAVEAVMRAAGVLSAGRLVWSLSLEARARRARC
ncbi:MAG: class I SAM-dependent methyltransferase [Chloroflexi bacterium]|nr:class I SAM-dependent methyltransferase [Chloroflexota bacterium]